MNFTKSPYEAMMKKPSHIQTPPPSKAPKGSRCHGCPYWRGIVAQGSAARPRSFSRAPRAVAPW